MAAENPWDPFQALRKALQDALSHLGIEVITWALIPDGEGGGGCQVMFRVKEEAFLDDNARQLRQQFNAMLQGQRVVEHERKVAENEQIVREKLLNISKEGIFDMGDDSPEE